MRLVGLVDSRVTLQSTAKGRSSSRAIRAILERTAALLLAGHIYLSFSFAPTRLNVADDPTRHAEVRAPARALPSWVFDSEIRDWLAGMPMRRAPVAAWLRFFVNRVSISDLRQLKLCVLEGRSTGAFPLLSGPRRVREFTVERFPLSDPPPQRALLT